MVEHRLAKARVASSNLVSRSIPPSGASRVGYGGLERTEQNQDSPAKARYPSGKGEVCKTFMRRFDPGPRLQSFLRHQVKKTSDRRFEVEDKPLAASHRTGYYPSRVWLPSEEGRC